MFWKKEKFRLVIKGENFFIRHLGTILSIAVILAALFLGIFIGRKIEAGEKRQTELLKIFNKDAKPGFNLPSGIDFALFWQIWEKVRTDYVYQPVDEAKIFYGALQGMVAGLNDPYSVFFEPQVAKEFAQELAGEFEGVGAEIGIKNNALVVVAPLLDSPAERAGLKAGDKILMIDEKDTNGISLDYAVKSIRGKGGTKVKLTIMRDGFPAPKEFVIMRDKIVVKSVQWRMLDKNIAYIKLLQFGDDTWNDWDKVVRQIVLKNPKGVILDLRNNPGGYLDAAVKIAGEWLPDEVVVSEKSKGEIQPFRANGKGRFKNLNTVALINKGSASGSEIVAGALKDYNKAVLIGEKSFGKGSVQDYREYPGGGALKLTIALWLTPNGNSINGEGIEPNVSVSITEEDMKADKDPQLEKAKSLFKQ